MKKRLVTLIITLVGLLIMLLISFFLGTQTHIRITLAVQLIIITFLFIYMFGGMGKLVSSIIYGIFIALLLVIFPKYDMALIFIGTFLFALNPLHDLELSVEKKFPEERSIISQLRGTFEPYYEYRREIKNYYHLPQMKKVYNKPNYVRLRQALTIVMSMLAVFLLIREVNNLVNLLKNFDIHVFFASTYSVIGLVVSTVILYRKGFQSMINLLTILIFPPLSYTLYLMITPNYLSVILGTLVIVVGVFAAVYQYIAFRGRIVYEYYHYYDTKNQREVFANALFEPYVYNDSFNLSVEFVLGIDINKFNKYLHNIVVYADFKKFFITAYTNNMSIVCIYTDFHNKRRKDIEKFVSFLENITEDKVKYTITEDIGKTFYETEFFHSDDYIVARTIYLAELLKKLSIQSNVIISIVAYFENIDDVIEMSNTQSVTRLHELDIDGIITVRIDVKSPNIDYIIDSKTREVLLDLLINKGKYIRVSVYY